MRECSREGETAGYGINEQPVTRLSAAMQTFGTSAHDGVYSAAAAVDASPARQREITRQLTKMEDQYFHTPQELAADLIGLYLMNPKKAKAEMPEATRLVRDILNKGDVVKFYSMPLAAMVAAIW